MKTRIVLAGGGHAHLGVLADWSRQALPGTERWLITSARCTAYSGMLPGWLAGAYRTQDLVIDLAPLAERAGARLVIAKAVGLDADARRLRLSTGEDLSFDLLSLATGGEANIAHLAALGDRLVPARPVGAFIGKWSALLACETPDAPIHVAVAGGGAAGVELALGAQAALRRRAGESRVSLISPRDGFLSGHASQVRRRAFVELQKRGITVHFARAAGTEGGLLLSSGGFLAADGVIAATGSRAPRWLAQSGLACTEAGFVAVGADMRSLSHSFIFAAGDIINRTDRRLERSGVHAVKAGPVLAANIRAAIVGAAPREYQPRSRTLYLMALGDGRAILSWGRFVAAGRWVWRIKDWIDRSFVGRYQTPSRQER